jgi:hypothetical protein
MPRRTKTVVETAPKSRKRKFGHRFPGIDRSVSKSVNELESKLALAERNLKKLSDTGPEKPHEILAIYRKLSLGNRRQLLKYAHFLLGKPPNAK